MSIGTATERAHRRDAEITRLILESNHFGWRTPLEWWQAIVNKGQWIRPYEPPNISQVNRVLRTLYHEGDVARRKNPDDARSRQFCLTV